MKKKGNDNCTKCGKPRETHKLASSTCSYVAPPIAQQKGK